jgi:hypothetical protein
LDAGKVEHKKHLEQLKNDLDLKLEKLRAYPATLIHQNDPYKKQSYLSPQLSAEAPSVSFKEELVRVE